MVWVSTRSKFVPYVVEVDKLGYAFGAQSALTENTTRISTDRMVRYELAAFIRNAREVITDPAAEQQCIVAIVDDSPILGYYVKTHPAVPIKEVGCIFEPRTGFAVPRNSSLRVNVNEQLLTLWRMVLPAV